MACLCAENAHCPLLKCLAHCQSDSRSQSRIHFFVLFLSSLKNFGFLLRNIIISSGRALFDSLRS